MKNIFAIFLLNLLASITFAQVLTVDNTSYTPQQIIGEKLITGCLEVSNISSNDSVNLIYGVNNSNMGYFNSNGSNFPIEKGLILVTGPSNLANGPNSMANSGMNMTTGSDADLASLTTGTIYDAAIIEFDFVPSSDTLRFNYVFASEEYNEFVCTDFNDVFGFFLSGPNPAGGNYISENIAVIPNTNTVVAINTINSGVVGMNGTAATCDAADPNWASHSNYFINNEIIGSGSVEFDGHTVKMTAWALVTPCQTYHLKLAVGDVGDGAWDSAVFLEEGSFFSGALIDVSNHNHLGISNEIFEGCDNYYVFSRTDTTNISDSLFINYDIIGTAQMGIDYNDFPSQICILPGQITDTVYYSALIDGMAEGLEYFVFSTDAGCPCSQQTLNDTIWIHDTETPILQILPDTTICSGDSIEIVLYENNANLDVSDLNIVWNTGSTDSILYITANTSQTFSADVTYACGFDTTLYQTITVIPCGFLVVVNDTSICTGVNTQINLQIIDGTAPYTFQWNNGLPATEGPHTVSPLVTTNYIVTVTDANGFTTTDTATVEIIESLNSELTASMVSCYGFTDGAISLEVLNGSAAYLYTWENNNNVGMQISSNQNLQNISEGTYNVTITDANACTGENTIDITQPSLLITSANPTNISCFGMTDGEIDLDIMGGTPPYSYTWSDGSHTEDIGNLEQNLFFVTVEDTNNCIALDTGEIAEPFDIIINENFNSILCYGDQTGVIDIDVTGGVAPYQYLWSNQSVSEDLGNIIAGNYIVTVTDNSGCSKISQIILNQPNELIVSLPSDYTHCNNETEILASVEGGTIPYSFLWSDAASTSEIHDVSTNQTQTYIVTVTDANNCVTEDEITVTIVSVELNVYANNDTVCPGNPVLVTTNIQGGIPPYTIYDNGQISSFPITVYPNGLETYTLQVVDACGNTDDANVDINTYPLPQLSFNVDILSGCPPLKVHFNQNSYDNTYFYTWNFDDINENNLSLDINPYHTFSQSGLYDISLQVTDNNGCKNQLTLQDMINVFPKPDAKFYVDEDVVSFIDAGIYFDNHSIDNYYNFWMFDDGDSSIVENPYHNYENAGIYYPKLVVENQYGCLDTAIKKIEVQNEFTLFVPTAFSPDNDGINDGFKAVGNGIDLDNYYIAVYNRWGEKIWESTDLFMSWNGTAKDRKFVQIGTYKWIVVCRDFKGVEHTKSGNITVIR